MWGSLMEYIKTSGNSTFATTVVNALTLASEGTVGSFLTKGIFIVIIGFININILGIPTLINRYNFFINIDEKTGNVYLGRWNDDILWQAMGSLIGAEIYGTDKQMPGYH